MQPTTSPNPTAWIIFAIVIAVVIFGGDALARAIDLYATIEPDWPGRWRLRARHRDSERAPYRRGEQSDWEQVRRAGIPRSVSCAMLPVVGVALMWSLACVLAFGDVADVFAGRRTLARTAAVLALVWGRAALAWMTLAYGYVRSSTKMMGASLAAIALDVALWRLPLPCSDIRADDERVGLAGAIIGAVALVAFAWSARPIANTTETDPSRLPRMN